VRLKHRRATATVGATSGDELPTCNISVVPSFANHIYS
jgi:uncharacterized membrane protein YraQ (UPF0718 family)